MPVEWGVSKKATHRQCRACKRPWVKLQRGGTLRRHQHLTKWAMCYGR